MSWVGRIARAWRQASSVMAAQLICAQGWLNLISDVHTWNLHTPFGGLGMYVTGSSNRFSNNYLDCNAMYGTR